MHKPVPATCPMSRSAAEPHRRFDIRRLDPRRLDPRRLAFAAVGLLCVGVGALGVVVPGLPTTIFLIAASWCFTRSCPWLERKLIRNRFFAPFMRYMTPGAVMPVRARVISTVMLWAAVLTSTGLLLGRDITVWVPIVVMVSGAVGTVAIWRVARPRPATVEA